jgi:hypothetical protein
MQARKNIKALTTEILKTVPEMFVERERHRRESTWRREFPERRFR